MSINRYQPTSTRRSDKHLQDDDHHLPQEDHHHHNQEVCDKAKKKTIKTELKRTLTRDDVELDDTNKECINRGKISKKTLGADDEGETADEKEIKETLKVGKVKEKVSLEIVKKVETVKNNSKEIEIVEKVKEIVIRPMTECTSTDGHSFFTSIMGMKACIRCHRMAI